MLTKNTIAQLLNITSDALDKMALILLEQAENGTAAAAPQTNEVKRPGRPRKGAGAVPIVENTPATETAPATQTTTAAPAEPEPTKPKGGKTLDELKALIAPLVKAARGGEVKALLNKHAPADYNASEANPYTLSLLSERPEVHEAFVQDIEMLKM